MTNKIVYISIGNSDDRLSQRSWSQYAVRFRELVALYADEVHGEWYSAPDAPYQNACICAEVDPVDNDEASLQAGLRALADEFRQDSIAWAEVPETVFLS